MKKETLAQLLILHTFVMIVLFSIRTKAWYEWLLLALHVLMYGWNLYHLAKGGNDDEM